MNRNLTENGEVPGSGNRPDISLDDEMTIRSQCRETAETTFASIRQAIESNPLLSALFQIDPEAYKNEMEASLLQTCDLLTPNEASVWKCPNNRVTTLGHGIHVLCRPSDIALA